MRNRITLLMLLASVLMTCAAIGQSAAVTPSEPMPQGMRLDLSKPFHTRSPWQLVVTEGTPVKDYGDSDAPGAVTLCLQRNTTDHCVSDPVMPSLRATTPDDPHAWESHYVLTAKVVYPKGPGAAPLLLLVTGSLNSGDGDQITYTQLIKYDASRDEFVRVFDQSTGHNNNQEIRFVTDGPLRGSVISAEPQQHPPYGYWMVVNTLSDSDVYRQALRYPSATHYNDGNQLAVIDSEMPTIQKRLGLWKPGQPLPTPSDRNSKPCIKQTLSNAELWCK